MIPIVIFPSNFVTLDEDDDMKYILQASFDGRLKSDEGFLSATGDLCTLTAASGKDLYLTTAKVVLFTNSSSSVAALADEVVLKVNGVVVETTKHSWISGTQTGTATLDYEFRNIGHKVDATQILKLEVITLDVDTDVEGFIQAIEVPDGENPTTYTGS